MNRLRSIVLAGVLAAVVAALAAVPAGAATVSLNQGILKYTGAASEANQVRIYYDAQRWNYMIEDTGAASTTISGPWCTAYTPQLIGCSFGKVAAADIQLGGGGSSAQNQTSLLSVTLRAGSARDSLTGGPGPATTKLIGGSAGADMTGGKGPSDYTGGPADDVVRSRNGVSESVACGAGADTVDADATDTVAADCETVARGTAGDVSAPSAPDPVDGTALPADPPVGDPEPAPAPMTISQAPVTLDARNRVSVEVTCPETSSGG